MDVMNINFLYCVKKRFLVREIFIFDFCDKYLINVIRLFVM